jgi:hypothetical protein
VATQTVDVLFAVRAKIDEIMRAQEATRRAAEETRRAVAESRALGASFRSIAGAAAAFAGVNLSLQGIVFAVRNGVANGLRLAETFHDAADRLDTTATAVQVLDYTFRRGGQSIDEAQQVAFVFNKRILEAAAGSEAAAKPIHRLQLSVNELLAMPVERRLEAFGAALVRLRDDTGAMDAAIEILGAKSQKTFSNLERLGSAGGFDARKREITAAGQLIDEKLNAQLEEAKQNLEDFGRRWDILLGKIAGSAVDTINLGEQLAPLMFGPTNLGPPPRKGFHRALQDMAAAANPAQLGFLDGEKAPIVAAALAARKKADDEATAAAQARTIAEEKAALALQNQGEQLRAQVRAAQDALLSDEKRLEILQQRLDLVRAQGAAGVETATGPKGQELAFLQFQKDSLALEREIAQLTERIAQARARTAAEVERAAAAARREQEAARKAVLDQVELEVRRKELLVDALEHEREILHTREDLSGVEKQKQINDLLEREKLILSQIILLKMRAAKTATEAERVQLDADIQALLQRQEVLGQGNKSPKKDWQTQIGLADTLRGGIDGLSRAFGDAVTGARNFGEAASEAIRGVASELAAAAVRAIILRSIMSAAPGIGSFLGLGTMGFAAGGYTGPGGRDEVAGIVHRGEVVIPKTAVDRTGPMPWLAAIQRARAGIRIPGFAEGGFVGDMGSRIAAAFSSGEMRFNLAERSERFLPSDKNAAGSRESIVVNTTNHFPGGVTPPQLSSILAEHDRQLPAMMADAFARAKAGLRGR